MFCVRKHSIFMTNWNELSAKEINSKLREWKKLPTEEIESWVQTAFELIRSEDIESIRDGMLHLQAVGRKEPDLIRPIIPVLLKFLNDDYMIEENLSEAEADAKEQLAEEMMDKKYKDLTEVEKEYVDNNFNEYVDSKYADSPTSIIQKDVIRTIGIIGRRKVELFSDAIYLIEKLIEEEEHDWVINAAKDTLEILKKDV